MTTSTHPPILHQNSWASSHAKMLLPPDTYTSQKIKYSFSQMLFPHIITALHGH